MSRVDFSRQNVLVAGLGISGRSVTEILRAQGVSVTTVDERNPDADLSSFDMVDWDRVTLVVTSPVFPPSTPFLRTAAEKKIPVWSEVEFAWRTRVAAGVSSQPAPWVGITGTNGKTTTTEMTAAIMAAAGRTVPAVGNIGEAVSAAAQDTNNEGLVVELSSFALHYTESLALEIAVWTNIGQDHLDWHGGFAGYAADKAKVFTDTRKAIIFNAQDPVVSQRATVAAVAPGCMKVGFTLEAPASGQIGVENGWVVDHSSLTDSAADPTRLYPLSSLANLSEPDGTVYPHLLADALAATGVALASGIDSDTVVSALSVFSLDAHRIQTVETYQNVRFIDDSKATNGLAAQASLTSFAPRSVVWIAGGLAKGAEFASLVGEAKEYLKAVVLIGKDQSPFATALASVAPDVPVAAVSQEYGKAEAQTVMDEAVEAAMGFADGSDVVLLAPATASMDQFASYADRGTRFATAAHEWVRRHG